MKALKSLGITKKNHRLELLSAIKGLISEGPLAQSPMRVEQQGGEHSSNNSMRSNFQVLQSSTSYSQSYCGSSMSSHITQSRQEGQGFEFVSNSPSCVITSGSVCGQPGFVFQTLPRSRDCQLLENRGCYNAVSHRQGKSKGFRKLVLTLQGDQISAHGNISRILSWFVSIDPSVEVQEMRKCNTYTLTFQDHRRAKQALIEYREKKFKIAVKFPKKPSPSSPMEYISLEDLKIRIGKSLNGDRVGILRKGQKVTVNQIKGKRARLIRPKQEVKDWGWVSMYSKDDGQPLLTPVNEMYDNDN